MSAPVAASASLNLRMSPDSPVEKARHRIRQLVWVYFWLLLIEGALRKWILPSFSNELLLIRDPVMLAIYYYTIPARVFPRNFWATSLWLIAALSVVGSFLLSTFNLLAGFVPIVPLLEIAAYGVRTNFLHLPLIFVIASVFDEEDVKKFGWWTIVLMIPMGLLMVAQFQASPDSFINRTAGLGEAEQLTAGGGKIRPPGTFSFISGSVFYMTFAAAFLIYGALTKTVYKNWLLILSGAALVVSVVVSGSRACVASVLIVVLAVIVIFLVRPRAVNRIVLTGLVVVVVAFLLSFLPIFKEGAHVLSDRFTDSAEAADTTITKGMISRVFGDFTEGLGNLDKFPMFGYGIGIGTNVGGRILVGRPAFLLAESEWSRVLGESGPILGLTFLLWRTLFTLQLLLLSLSALKRYNILPILLFSSGFVLLLEGQLGQPTTLGFATLVNGLCLAATRPRAPDDPAVTPSQIDQSAEKSLPRRSVYANRLHGPGIGAEHTNGSADR